MKTAKQTKKILKEVKIKPKFSFGFKIVAKNPNKTRRIQRIKGRELYHSHLECKINNHYKFYDIIIIKTTLGYSVDTMYGRIGTSGVYGKPKVFDTFSIAKLYVDKLETEKLGKDYKYV